MKKLKNKLPVKKNNPALQPKVENGNSKIQLFEIFFLVIGGALFIFLFMLLKEFISPILIYISILVILYPLRKYLVVKNILLLSTGLILLWTVYLLGSTLFPFFIALAFAYIFSPIVTKLELKRIPRWLSSMVTVSVLLIIIVVSIIVITPIALVQFQSLLNSLNKVVSQFTDPLISGNYDQLINGIGINPEEFNRLIKEKFNLYLEDIVSLSLKGALSLVSGFAGILTSLLNIILIPLLIFYLLKDFILFKDKIKKMIPPKNRGLIISIYSRVDKILSQYLRGTAIIAILDGLLVTAFFWFIGVQYSVVLGVSSAILYFIPYVGFLIMIGITSIIISLNPTSFSTEIILALSFLLTLHTIENFIIAPQIFKKQIGLHPVLVILSLFIFGYLFGFFGLIFAIPITALLVSFLKEWEESHGDEDGLASLLEHEDEN